jgi:hypothetical protein
MAEERAEEIRHVHGLEVVRLETEL